jgi:MFS family permease
MWLIDRIGRKKLIYSGVLGMIVTLVLIGLYFLLQSRYPLQPGLLLALIGLYIFFCAISICTVIFVLLSEMYPARIRGAAMSAAGLSLWTGTYLIGQLTPWLLIHLAPSGRILVIRTHVYSLPPHHLETASRNHRPHSGRDRNHT